jgi:phage baseplate assembly protein V
MLQVVQTMIAKALRQASNMLRRGEISLTSAAGFVQVQGYDGESFDDVPLWQQYGFTSRPPADSEVLTIHLGGASQEATVIASNNDDHRPSDLADEEVITYGKSITAGQAQVRHKPDGSLALACATGKFVEVGGADAKLLKGESYNTALQTFLSAVSAMLSVPGPLAGDPSLAAKYTTLVSQMTAALATKGKVA